MRYTTRKFQIEKRHLRLALCGWMLFLNFSCIYSQEAMEGMGQTEYNLTSFEINQRNITEELLKLTPDAYESNPDFGYLPYGEEEGYFEVISKRTATSRFFRKIDEPSLFYIREATSPINYIKDGYWRSINTNLRPKEEGVFVAKKQPMPTSLNLHLKRSGIQKDKNTLYFNHVRLSVNYKNNTQHVFDADWSNYTVGDDGIYITDVFPKIDMKITFHEGGVKSAYIVKEKISNVATMEIIDQLSFSNEDLTIDSVSSMNNNFKQGSLYIGGSANDPRFIYEPIKIWDNSGIRSHGFRVPYNFNNTLHQISFQLDSTIVGSDSLVYPVTIDPLVYGTNSAGTLGASAYIMTIDTAPGSCSNFLNVTFPPNATPLDMTATWQFKTNYDCFYPGLLQGWMSDVSVWITSGCGAGVSPVGGGVTGTSVYGWVCPGAPCDAPGTWTPTLPYGASGNQSLVTCYSPSCSPQTMQFTIHSAGTQIYTDCNCATVGGYADIYLTYWSVTVRGRTLETIADQTYNPASCSGTNTLLDPGAGFGVPPYSYSWNTGATSSTINAPNAGSPYSVVVTGACGVQQTVNFTINCPLSVTLKQFTAERIQRKVLLQWETLSETDNDYFMVQRAGEDGIFYDLLKQDAVGNSNTLQHYSTYDYNPLKGTSYYRLQIYDKQGNISTSEVKSIGFDGGRELRIVPNPNAGTFQMAYNFPEKGNYLVELLSVGGKVVKTNQISIEEAGFKEIKLNTTLRKGVYFLKLHTKNQVIVKKVVVE